jgi:magnesium transporter
MNAKELAETLSSSIASGNSEKARSAFASLEPTDLIDALPFLSLDDAYATIELSTQETASFVLLALEAAERVRLLERKTPEMIAKIAGTIDSYEATDIISELPQDLARGVLERLTPQEVSEVESLMRCIMQTELVEVPYDATAKETIEKVAILAAFMPAIIAKGGNVEIQATAIR